MQPSKLFTASILELGIHSASQYLRYLSLLICTEVPISMHMTKENNTSLQMTRLYHPEMLGTPRLSTDQVAELS